MARVQKIRFKIITILFLVALVLPNVIQISGLEKDLNNNENRKYQNFPKINIKKPIKTIGNIKNYYLENFGLKTTLVNAYINFKLNILKESPIPNRLVIGKNNWLFLGNEYNNTLNDSYGNDSFTSKELTATVKYIKGLHDYFKSVGVSFYLVIPPDKDHVYQEYLPYTLEQNITKLNTLKHTLKSTSDVNIIDLSIPLLENKKKKQLYLKTDSHWNYFGSYYSYNYLIDILNKDYNINKVPLKDFILKEQPYYDGDLQKMINKSDVELTQQISKREKSKIEIINYTETTLHIKNKANTLKLMLHRDSFTNAWIPFLNESFGEIIYYKRYTINKQEIEAFKPDLVIFEIVERNIDMFGNTDLYKN